MSIDIEEKVVGESITQESTFWQEEIWQGIGKVIIKGLKVFLEEILEEDVSRAVKADRHQRTGKRAGYRNGSYKRDFLSKFGLVSDLIIPRARDMKVEHLLFDRYQRRQREVDSAIGQLFINGVSTRKLRSICRDLFGAEISASTVSVTSQALDKEMALYQNAPIDGDVEFLFLDGMVQKVREINVVKKVVLGALAVYKDGRKELIGLQLSDGETLANWRGFLVSLKSRGLDVKTLRMVTVDGNPALLAALKEIFPFVRVQRCIAHKLRNVVTKLKRSQQPTCGAEAKLIFAAQNRTEAIRRFKAWKEKWWVEAERAVRCMEKDLAACLRYHELPKNVWKQVRTTNILERSIREVRRRTKPMGGVFTNERSCDRIIYGISRNLNENWQQKSVNAQKEITQNS
jgi:putative transposase